MSEYKKITTPTLTRFVLETMTAGATGSANIATSMGTVGKTIKRQQEAKDDKVPQKPRQGPLRPQTGAGAHKDKKRDQKQGKEKHRKPFYEQHTDHEVEMAQSDTYQLAKQAAALHKILMRASEEQGLEGWQQAKITKAADYINAVYKNLNHDVGMDGHIGEHVLSELDKPSGTLYIILLRDRTESVRVVGDFGTFPAEVQARASKVGIKDKEGRKERPLKVNFLMTSASQALAELDKALADVDFIGGEKAEFVFKNSAFETDIEDEVRELNDLIRSGADERFKNYEEPEVGSEPDTKPKGVDHFVVGPDGKRRRVPMPGKPSSQMGGHSVEQPKTFTYQLKKTELGPKLRSMGFKVDGSQIVLSKQQRDQLLAKMGDQQFGQIFGQGGKFTEGGRDDQFSLGGRLERDDDFRNRERNAGVEHERNNYQVSINGRPWKVFADQRQAMNIARSLKMKGKQVEVYPTGAPPSESVREGIPYSYGFVPGRKKPNATTRHLRDYPVSDKDVAKPVKKPEKKKPEQGVAEGTGKNVVKSVKVGNFRHDLVDTGMGWQVRIYNGDELYDTGMSKNSEQKGLAALEDAVAYTEKQTRTKRQGVSEGEGKTQKYEMMMRNGQVKKFVAKDDADAKRIAAGHGAKSVIRLQGNVPAGKVTEMDKSQPSHGRDGKISHSTYGSRDKKGSDYFKGKEAPGKAITAKQASKDALDILKKQGMAEETGDNKFDAMMGDIKKSAPIPVTGYVAVEYASENQSDRIKGVTLKGKPMPSSVDIDDLDGEIEFGPDEIERHLIKIGRDNGWSLIDPGHGRGYSELFFDTNANYTSDTQSILAKNIVNTVNQINKFFSGLNSSLQSTGLPGYKVAVWQEISSPNGQKIGDIDQIKQIALTKVANSPNDPGEKIGKAILRELPKAEKDGDGYAPEDFAYARKIAKIYITKGERAGLEAQLANRRMIHVSDLIDELLSHAGAQKYRTIKDLDDQGMTEGSLETDNMVSHIGQIIQSIYPRGGDKNTYMKLVAQQMPHVVRDHSKLFRRAFSMAYDKFFHIDQDDDQDDDFDYTDYSMRKGERGMEEDKIKGVDGKACWKGKRYAGKVKKADGTYKDKCVEDVVEALEEVKKGLYYYVNKRKKAGTSRPASHPDAPSPQDWKNAAKTAKKEDAYSESLSNQLDALLNEKAPPGDKYERMVKHIKKGYSKDGKITDKERSIAYATAWKAKNKAKK